MKNRGKGLFKTFPITFKEGGYVRHNKISSSKKIAVYGIDANYICINRLGVRKR